MFRHRFLVSSIVAGFAAGACSVALAQGTPMTGTSSASSPSRAEVKSQTKAASRSGKLQPPGEAPQPVGETSRRQHGDKSMAARGTTTTRADVKAQTKAERQSGMLQPPGQAPQPVDEPPKK